MPEPVVLGVPLPLDDLFERCGYANPQRANGYGCDHPDNEDDGRCSAGCCPIANELSGSEPLDLPLMAAHGIDPSEDEWMVPFALGRGQGNG